MPVNNIATIINTETKEIIGDTLTNIKFSGISWKNNDGFFYSSYDKPEGSELSEMTDNHKLYYHKLNTDQNQDKLIFGGKSTDKYRYVSSSVSEDNKYLFITASNLTDGNKLFVMNLTKDSNKIEVVSDDETTDDYVIETDGNTFYILTNSNAPNKKLVRTKYNRLNQKYWIDVIPETENVLSVSKGGGYFFAKYFADANSKILQYKYDGELVREIEFSGKGNVSGFGGKEDQKEIFYNFFSKSINI